MSEFLTVHYSEYLHLVARDEKLTALENAGVDNWEGYGPALEERDE
jgi:hypothetical protein